MPTHQLSETSGASAPGFSARGTVRPLKKSVEVRSARDPGVETAVLRDTEQEGTPPVLRVLTRGVALPAERGGSPAVARPFSARQLSKRVLDVLGAILLGVVFAPLIVVIVVLLRAEGGPVIYRHRRVGRDGAMFECMKFRSMIPDADHMLRNLLETDTKLRAEWVYGHKLRNDPRVTRVGRFLRRTSLDELPQIWNVLRGEMSLVGPRPVVREELMRYGRCSRVYLSAKPGITGLWQVTGRNDTDYRRRVALDVYYVRKHNLVLDLFILMKTTRVVLGGGGAY